MAVFTNAYFVVIGMFCAGSLPRLVVGENGMLIKVELPTPIDADRALKDVSDDLLNIDNELENITLDGSPRSFSRKMLTMEVRERMEYQKKAYEELMKAQQFRVESETRFNSTNNTVDPLTMAHLTFELENAAATEYQARTIVISRNIDVVNWQKMLKIEMGGWRSNDGDAENVTKFLEKKDAEIARFNRDMNFDMNEHGKMVAAAQQTQRDIESIMNHYVPRKYRAFLRGIDPIDQGRLVIPKAMTQSTKETMFERLQRLRIALGYGDKRYTVPWISENDVQFYIPDNIQKELFTTYLFFCPSILKNASFIQSEPKKPMTWLA